MKSWRERFAEAEARGALTDEDRADWQHFTTCPAQEIARNAGLPFDFEIAGPCAFINSPVRDILSLWRLGTAAQAHALHHQWADCTEVPRENLIAVTRFRRQLCRWITQVPRNSINSGTVRCRDSTDDIS